MNRFFKPRRCAWCSAKLGMVVFTAQIAGANLAFCCKEHRELARKAEEDAPTQAMVAMYADRVSKMIAWTMLFLITISAITQVMKHLDSPAYKGYDGRRIGEGRDPQ